MRLTVALAVVILTACSCSNHERNSNWQPKKGDHIENVMKQFDAYGINYEESVLYGSSRKDIIYKINNTKYRAIYTTKNMVIESNPKVYDPLMGYKRNSYRVR